MDPIADAEIAKTFGLAAPLVNRFYLTAIGPIARLTFGEQEPGEGAAVHMRNAVSMTADNLIQLRDLLNDMCANMRVIDTGSSPDG